MSLIKRMRRQKAVWWKRSSTTDEYGRYTFDEPVEIDCRWEDRAEEFVNKGGERLVSAAVVYVDRVMEAGDKLKLGALESDTSSNPVEETEAFEIQTFSKIPNLRNTETLLTAYL